MNKSAGNFCLTKKNRRWFIFLKALSSLHVWKCTERKGSCVYISGVVGTGWGWGGCRGMERESSREEVTVISQNCLSVKWVSTGEETQVVYNEIYTNFKHTAFTLSKQAGKPSIWKVKELTKEKVRNSLAYLVPAPVQQLSQGIHHLIPTDDLCRGRGQNSWAPRQICLGEKGFLGLETTFTSHLFMK